MHRKMERFSAEDYKEPRVSPSPNDHSQPVSKAPVKRNAFTELMTHKPAPKSVDAPTKRTLYDGRAGLGPYTVDPASFPQSRVVYYNEKFVVINDLYPKAAVHLLILPRDAQKNLLRPQVAFDDPNFLDECQQEEKKVRHIVAEELRRRYGKSSALEKQRIDAYEADEPLEQLPPGRDWAKEVMSGIHANPSMDHLHIHVMSRDMVNEPMKRRNHYLSFTTDFFVGLDQFPLAEDDRRRHYQHFPEDMLCWRCGQNFQNKMIRLKEHLAEEFEAWKQE